MPSNKRRKASCWGRIPPIPAPFVCDASSRLSLSFSNASFCDMTASLLWLSGSDLPFAGRGWWEECWLSGSVLWVWEPLQLSGRARERFRLPRERRRGKGVSCCGLTLGCRSRRWVLLRVLAGLHGCKHMPEIALQRLALRLFSLQNV